MPTTDRRIDSYIAKAPEYARPILSHVRELVHEACPDVEETLKWGHPSFTFHGMLCGMAAFKQHATFGFWKHSLVVGDNGKSDTAMGSFGRLQSIKDLPPKRTMLQLIKRAMQLNVDGVKTPRKPRTAKPAAKTPPDLAAALRSNRKAAAFYDQLSPSHQREYIEWITEAKTDATRQRRLETTLEWLKEGKPRNWKYMNR